MKRLIRKALGLLPEEQQFNLIRKSIKLPYTLPEGLICKVAENEQELEQAFKILHDEYVRMGYMSPSHDEMRVTPWHALPTTTTLIAKIGSDIIGTVSVIRDGALGVPLEKVFQTKELKKGHRRIAEISALAISKSHQGTGGRILFPMMKFLYHYCLDYFGTDYIVIAVHPQWIPFYQAVLAFEKLEDSDKPYDFVQGAPAAGAFLNLKGARDQFAAIYMNKPANYNIYSYFIEKSFSELRFPDRSVFKIDDPIMNPKLFRHFFIEKTNLLDSFTLEQRQIINSLYTSREYDQILPKSPSQKNEALVDLNSDARILLGKNQFIDLRVIKAGKTKIIVVSQIKLRIRQSYEIELALGKFEKAKLKTEVTEVLQDNAYLMSIVGDEPTWYSYMKTLTEEREVKVTKEVSVQSSDGLVELKGQINEFSDFSEITRCDGPIAIDMSGVSEINSPGIILWINLMSKVKAQKVTLLKCPIEFIHSVNMMPDLAPEPTVIESFRLPLRCKSCEKTTDIVISTKDFKAAYPELPAREECPFCSDEMINDADEDYFNFILMDS